MNDLTDFFNVDVGDCNDQNYLSDITFTESDIEAACLELSSSSAAGPDGVLASLLKHVESHSASLSTIYGEVPWIVDQFQWKLCL